MAKKSTILFINDETGAITVDWVVLTAVIVTLGIAVAAIISPALVGTTGGIATVITTGMP